MGTFRVRLQLTVSVTPAFLTEGTVGDGWFGENPFHNPTSFASSSSALASILSNTDLGSGARAIATLIAVNQGVLRFQTLGSNIFLDGSDVPVEFNGLPAGFTATAAQVNAIYFDNSTDTNAYTIILQKDSSTESAPFITVKDVFTTITFPYSFVGTPPTMLQIVANGCGVKLNSNLAGLFPAFYVEFLDITGTYEIQRFKFELENDSPVTVGDTITVRSSNTNSDDLDLHQITSINIQYVTAAGVFTTTAVPSFNVEDTGSSAGGGINSELTFVMPNFTTAVQVIPYISGTQFSGSIPLGPLYTINFTTGSGIYRLVADKTNDTLYANGTPQLVNAKIPNPFIKTAFVP